MRHAQSVPSNIRTPALRAAVLTVALLATFAGLARAEGDPSKPLVRVNGTEITTGDLEFALFLRKLPADSPAEVRRRVLEQLVDRRLLQLFLDERKAKPTDAELADQIEQTRALIRKLGSDPDEVLKRLHLTEERLRSEIAIPLAWNQHARRMTTDAAIRDYWDKHRAEFDGTQLRASQIFLKLDRNPPPEDVKKAEERLVAIKRDIESGKRSFADAAKESEAPSRQSGGDVGFFAFQGRMPAAFSKAAFALKDKTISEPVRTPFGLHLIQITDRRPGDLSLEDARGELVSRLQAEMQTEILAGLRQKANVEWLADAPAP